jgi:hypothetical protein
MGPKAGLHAEKIKKTLPYPKSNSDSKVVQFEPSHYICWDFLSLQTKFNTHMKHYEQRRDN